MKVISNKSRRASLRAKRGWVRRHELMEIRARVSVEDVDRMGLLRGRLIAVNEVTGEASEFPVTAFDTVSSLRRKRREAMGFACGAMVVG